MADQGIAALLRHHKPASIRLTMGDGSTRELAVPSGKRKRWGQTVELMERLPWCAAELLNAKGQLLETVEPDEPPDGLEDLSTESSLGGITQGLGLMLKAQDVALRRHTELVGKLIDANLRLCNVLMGRVDSLEKGHASNLQLAEKYVRKLARLDEDGEGLLSSGPVEEVLALMAAKQMGLDTDELLRDSVPKKAPTEG